MDISELEIAAIKKARDEHDQDTLDDLFISGYNTYGHKFLSWVLDDMKKTISDTREKQYSYLVTFTLDPSKDEPVDDVEGFIFMQPKRVALRVKKAWVSKEHTKAGVAHWHMYLVTSKALRSDAFLHYKKRYGNVDISRSKYNSEADALSYISKESNPIKLI